MTPGLGDQRARELIASTWRLYQELAPDDMIIMASIDVITADGEVIAYSIGRGQDEVTRLVTDVSDPVKLLEAYEATRAVVTDATPRDVPS